MENPPSMMTQFAIAALGAAVITSFAVTQGQDLGTALCITLASAAGAILVNQAL